MNILDKEFENYRNDPRIQILLSKDVEGKTILNALQNEQDRWDDFDRLNIFREAIEQHRYMFEGKVVLDVSCGLGFLGIFAARSGAKKVYLQDSSLCNTLTKVLIERNSFNNIIELCPSTIENCKIEHQSVDIIVSDWVSSFGVNGSIVESIIKARDLYLKKEGNIFPDQVKFYMSALSDLDYCPSRFNFWDNVYGYKMPGMKELYYTEAVYDYIEKDLLISDKTLIHNINILKITLEELSFIVEYKLKFNKKGEYNSFVIWLEMCFESLHKPLRISYGPGDPKSSIYPIIFYLKKPIKVNVGASSWGTLAIKRETKGGKNLLLGKISYHYEGMNSYNQFFKIDF